MTTIPLFLTVDKSGNTNPLFETYNKQNTEEPITKPQLGYAQKLFRTKVVHPDFTSVLEEEIESWTKRQASDFISKMRVQPDADKSLKLHRKWVRREIPHGCYLVDVPGKTGTLEMWLKVDQSKPDETKIFRLRGAPGKLASKRIDKVHLLEHLTPVLLLDPEAAQRNFAEKLEHCMRCGSPLTNPQSRARLMGDDCYNK